jgi:UDP-N-acetylmuramyl pentapeptide phosphotransferase/UDP-N-acetylglucosamine-1-phosphate transferase
VNPLLLSGLAGAAVSALLVALILRRRWHWAVDHPNERSLHTDPTPRIGGIAVMAGVIVATAVAHTMLERPALAATGLAVLLAGISLADDRAGLPISTRLAAHLLAAALFAAYLTDSAAPWWWMSGAILAMAAMTNFFNFMDGANGLAGGMAVAGFGCYGIAASLAGDAGFAASCFGIAGAAAGFLAFNLSGRIFMGDGGSVPLGFLAAALGLEGCMRSLWPAWFMPLAFAPFVVDASVTLLRRALRGERFWLAHREHYYQRLVRSGWSHARLAVLEYFLMVACAAAALTARAGSGGVRLATFATIALLLLVTGVAIDVRWRRRAEVPPPSP